MLLNVNPLVCIFAIIILVVTEEDLVETGIIIITTTVITLMSSMIFEVFMGLQIAIGGKVIGNKTNEIMVFHSGLTSGASYVKPLVI